jgi:hypothetical protein
MRPKTYHSVFTNSGPLSVPLLGRWLPVSWSYFCSDTGERSLSMYSHSRTVGGREERKRYPIMDYPPPPGSYQSSTAHYRVSTGQPHQAALGPTCHRRYQLNVCNLRHPVEVALRLSSRAYWRGQERRADQDLGARGGSGGCLVE